MKYQGFQNLYQHLKKDDQKTFESFDKISSYLQDIIIEMNTQRDFGSFVKTYKQLQIPRGLGSTERGLLIRVDSPYNHLLIWNGDSWSFADEGSNYIALFRAAPTAPGWQLCDGSNISYLNSDSSISAPFNVDNLVANPAYLKATAAYTGVINAAVPPVISGATALGFAALGNNTTTTNVLAGAVTVAGSPHTHIDVGHSHNVGTLINTLPADPVDNLELLPYFRR